MYKLVALDIDGTLLTSRGNISVRMREAIGAARSAGLLVTVATGRRYVTATPVIDELDLRMAVIVQTGALIVDPLTRERLYQNPLPTGAASEALRILVALGLQPLIYENAVEGQQLFTGPERYDSPGGHEYVIRNPDLVRRYPYDVLLAAEGVDSAPLQLAVIDALAPLQRATEQLMIAGCRTIISYSGNLDTYFMEVFRATCSKGAALRHLAGLYGINIAETVAIGDNYNDVEMLADAGLGVAMGNAEPDVKRHADVVTRTNDEDGAALVIEQILAGEPLGV